MHFESILFSRHELCDGKNGGRGRFPPPRFSLGQESDRTGRTTSLDWGHHSPGSDDAFPTPFLMESIVVIVLFPFLTVAFVLIFATVSRSAADLAFACGLAFACPKPNATAGFTLHDYVDFSVSFDQSRSNAPNQANHRAQHDRCLCQAREPLHFIVETAKTMSSDW